MIFNNKTFTLDSLNKGVVYLILNLKNHKTYVGISSFPRKRWSDHINNGNLKVDKDIQKYGAENFIFVILEEVHKDELRERERFWIKETNSFENGYNQKP